MKFRLLHSVHIAQGRAYQKGDIVESNSDLTQRFPLKFERLTASEVVEAPSRAVPIPSEAPVAVPSAKGGGMTPFGEDVSEDFPIAGESDLQVFQKGTSLFVVDPDQPAKALNPKALKGTEVSKFIRTFLKKG